MRKEELPRGSEQALKVDLDWREPFEWREPAHWQEGLGNIKALAHSMLADARIHAAKMLIRNRERAQELYHWHDGLHTPPAAEHYRHTYLWDSGFCQIMLAQAAELAYKSAVHLETRLNSAPLEDRLEIVSAIKQLKDLAETFQRASVTEGFSVIKGQKANGFIPNLQYGEGTLWYEVEQFVSLDKVNKSSNYTQPPVLPLATYATYKSMVETNNPNAKLYLEEMYGSMDKFMRYFHDYRSNSLADKKIGVIEPHETGLDSLEQWDYIKPHRVERNGVDTPQEVDDRNRFADGGHFVVRLFERYLVAGGDLAKQRQLFWCNDVLINSIYFHNLQVMAKLAAELGKQDDLEFYENLANTVEQQMIDDMWQDDPDKVPMPGFYSLKDNGEPIETITVSNLMALTLPHLPEEKLKAVLNMMDEHFNVPYPLPSGSIKSPNYDPNNQEKDRLWRGPTWLNTNWYIAEHGLFMQAARQDISPKLRLRCKAWANRLTQASNELLDMNEPERRRAQSMGAKVIDIFTKIELEAHHLKEFRTGAYEHYNPHTGEGQRDKVRNFAWSWLARFMTLDEDYSQLIREIELSLSA
ncbi:MAG TPA: hypothetical protein VFT49_01880 [Candidatus Saccharimonadales bacterium]|nr:hypothetical protein [Candidatus Saccharimonadales bacterium]